ncbi:MAG: DUF4976 domain-containing protein [Verrucomicrobia bacterium]|nr:DUF4976 domain-containing protein [Verrucomicrobiota bacterium]NBS05511.1 DUF4976 domain-containing protein [Verrucomicrobiota bacterium]
MRSYLLLLLAPLSLLATDTAKPNLIFLITDQQTIEALGCAGNPYLKTPNLDRLAARGVRFEKSYSTYPLCCPSRASLFTSRTPHQLGVYANANADIDKKNVPTMGEVFQAGGYDTAYAGKWHLSAPFPSFKGIKMPGFEVLPLGGDDPHSVDGSKYGRGLTVDPNTANAAAKFIRQPHTKPFLLVVSILNPHDICEYAECEALNNLLPADKSKLPPARPNIHDSEKVPVALQKDIAKRSDWSDQKWREYLYIYYRLTEIADAEAGRVLKALDESGLANNTVVVFTSDHGEMMGSHCLVTKSKLYEESVAVPLIVAGPGVKPAIDRQHLISGLDMMPTLLDYAGIAAPASVQGTSIRPLVDGKSPAWRDHVVAEVNSSIECRMVRTAHYKYLTYAQGENNEQFFDMEKDMLEIHNLIADPSLADEIQRHRSLLAQWRKDTQDETGKKAPEKKNARKKTIVAKADSTTAKAPAVDREVAFKNRDKDKDGRLDAAEYIGSQKDPEGAKRRFERMDTNKDGFLSHDEFTAETPKAK